ncbi:MAG: hypothetical protein PHP57_13870 [Sideroxydans sp.]|nr:hypothetical protein [Sideroxydans sp.]
MNDKELLELAAKANWLESDVSYRWCAEEDAIIFLDPENQDHNGHDVEYVWNPLIDDGDAFRLAVKLGLSDFPMLVGTLALDGKDRGLVGCDVVRLAIVNAAALIGNAL